MVEESDPLAGSISEAAASLLEQRRTGVMITIIAEGPRVGSKLLVDEAGTSIGSLGNQALDSAVIDYAPLFMRRKEEILTFRVKDVAPQLETEVNSLLLFELIRAEPRIVICGAGHVGAALARLGALCGYQITLIDDREEFLSSDRFPRYNIELLLADSWANTVAGAIGVGRGVSVAIVTRGHAEDEQCLGAVIESELSYVGLIGSKRRTSIVIDRLRASGVSDERLQGVHAPIGLDIGAVTPEEVAVAILAEIIAVRRGGKGGSLSTGRRAG
jgi:xanthine dehydrogenase accessory factor